MFSLGLYKKYQEKKKEERASLEEALVKLIGDEELKVEEGDFLNSRLIAHRVLRRKFLAHYMTPIHAKIYNGNLREHAEEIVKHFNHYRDLAEEYRKMVLTWAN